MRASSGSGVKIMNIELVRLTGEYRRQLFDMLAEWKADIERNRTDMSPYRIWATDYRDFDAYIQSLNTQPEPDSGLVPDTTLFCLDRDRNIFVGAVNIRQLPERPAAAFGAGHIGDGIRPSERRKGYATAMIGLALNECRKLGIDRVLMCCNKDNIGSAKSIINNGGVLENEIEEDGQDRSALLDTAVTRGNVRQLRRADFEQVPYDGVHTPNERGVANLCKVSRRLMLSIYSRMLYSGITSKATFLTCAQATL